MGFSSVIGSIKNIGNMLKPHAPTIAVVAGSAAVLGGSFLACRATLKVDKVLEEHNAMMQHVHDAVEKLPDGSLTEKEIRHDKLQVYAATAGKFARLYGPAIGLSVAGFASIFYGFGMIKHWHAAALSTITALDEKFGRYRKKVIDNYGEEVDRKFFDDQPEATQLPEGVTVENPETGAVRKDDSVILEDAVETDFVRVFKCDNPKWEESYLIAFNHFYNKIDWYTKHLQAHRMNHVFMNTMLKEFGFEETGIGHFYGWTDRPGAAVNIDVIPCLRVFDHDEDSQFPMLIPLDYDSKNRRFNDEMDENDFNDAYYTNPNSVCFLLKFNVETDENGVEHQIYDYVYGNKNKVA